MAHAIAQNLFEMSALRTPVVAVVTGEGGSGGALALALADTSVVWCGANLDLPEPAPFPADPAECDLVFEANGGRTPLGIVGLGGQTFQVDMRFRLADGSVKSGPYIGPTIEGGRIDGDPATWQTVRIPVRRLLPKDAEATAVAGINLQYRGVPADRAALLVRAIRLEPAAETLAR